MLPHPQRRKRYVLVDGKPFEVKKGVLPEETQILLSSLIFANVAVFVTAKVALEALPESFCTRDTDGCI